jgi:hypothetical protein
MPLQRQLLETHSAPPWAGAEGLPPLRRPRAPSPLHRCASSAALRPRPLPLQVDRRHQPQPAPTETLKQQQQQQQLLQLLLPPDEPQCTGLSAYLNWACACRFMAPQDGGLQRLPLPCLPHSTGNNTPLVRPVTTTAAAARSPPRVQLITARWQAGRRPSTASRRDLACRRQGVGRVARTGAACLSHPPRHQPRQRCDTTSRRERALRHSAAPCATAAAAAAGWLPAPLWRPQGGWAACQPPLPPPPPLPSQLLQQLPRPGRRPAVSARERPAWPVCRPRRTAHGLRAQATPSRARLQRQTATRRAAAEAPLAASACRSHRPLLSCE